jgi:hypothetical protein
MTVMRWKWKDEEAEEIESNGMCRPRIYSPVCVLAKNIKEEEEEEGKGRRTNERVKNVCPAETPLTIYKRASARTRKIDIRKTSESPHFCSFFFSLRTRPNERTIKKEEKKKNISSASAHSFLWRRKRIRKRKRRKKKRHDDDHHSP